MTRADFSQAELGGPVVHGRSTYYRELSVESAISDSPHNASSRAPASPAKVVIFGVASQCCFLRLPAATGEGIPADSSTDTVAD